MRAASVGLVLVLVGLVLGAGDRPYLATADDNQAYLRILANTQLMKMAGMPELPEIPGNIPGLGEIPLPGKPMRMLEVRLFAPVIAPDNATAVLAIPAGLKLGPRLDLALYRPKKEEGQPAEVGPGAIPDFTLLRYWGSSPVVKAGQPEVFKWGDLTDEQKAALREQMQKAGEKAEYLYLYKQNWTTGYWPHGKATGIVDKKASLVGQYALTTTFTGNVGLDVPKEVDFLDGIKLTSPDLTQFPPLDQAMAFHWDPVPGVLGYYAMIVGMQGEKTMITWSSSEVKEDTMASFDYLPPERVAELVDKTVLMAPDRQEVTVPAGIFKDCDVVFMTMIGFGPGVTVTEGQPLPSLQTRSMLLVMLGGKGAEEQMPGG